MLGGASKSTGLGGMWFSLSLSALLVNFLLYTYVHLRSPVTAPLIHLKSIKVG